MISMSPNGVKQIFLMKTFSARQTYKSSFVRKGIFTFKRATGRKRYTAGLWPRSLAEHGTAKERSEFAGAPCYFLTGKVIVN